MAWGGGACSCKPPPDFNINAPRGGGILGPGAIGPLESQLHRSCSTLFGSELCGTLSLYLHALAQHTYIDKAPHLRPLPLYTLGSLALPGATTASAALMLRCPGGCAQGRCTSSRQQGTKPHHAPRTETRRCQLRRGRYPPVSHTPCPPRPSWPVVHTAHCRHARARAPL